MRSELKQFQMLKARLRKYHRVFTTPTSICPHDPPRNAITFKKRATKGLTVPSVEQFSGNKPPNRSGKGPIEDDAERIVEPNDCCGASPNLVPDGSVVSVYHPLIRTYRDIHKFRELCPHCPVRSPVKGIKLDVRAVQKPGQLPREGCLTRTACTDNDYPRMITQHSCLHIQISLARNYYRQRLAASNKKTLDICSRNIKPWKGWE